MSMAAQELLQGIDAAEACFAEREPAVQAFVPEDNRFERLRMEAAELLRRYPDPKKRPALFGVLAGVKDIFHAAGFVTRAGSRLPPEAIQGEEAECVAALKRAGALILGKTVTTEFAYFSPGPTRNPHHPGHTPGGSSSGSAAAVGAGLCALALGTQTIGSVIRPASFCGTFGLKPTYDRIPKHGAIPLSPSFDHVGLFTPEAASARLAAASLYKDWDAGVRAARKPVLGIPEGPYLLCASDESLAWFRAMCASLAEAGYELRGVPVMADFAEVRARHDRIMSAEAARVHAAWFERHADLYAPKTADLIRRGAAVTAEQLQVALAGRESFRAALRRTMIDHDLDLWICPSTVGPAPLGLESTGDPVMNLPWTQAGLPAVNLPAGTAESGLPLGLQLVGNWYKDESLLEWAAELGEVVGRS